MVLEPMVHRVRLAALRQGNLSDGQLLDRFIAVRDEAAFATLVHRHGDMVLGVCRRVLGHVQDAEDAFQATFLVLVRKAESILPREAVGNWLYGVAYRTALEAKARNARRRTREAQVDPMPHPAIEPQELWHDVAPVLDRELSRLPDKYRLPVVLCDLEGRGRQEVSQQLQLAEGTLSSRLARGRKLLAGRLARQGIALSAGTLALALAPATASAGAPPALVSSTIQAATLIAAGESAAAVVSAPVAALAEGVLEAMFATKLKTLALSVLCVVVLGTGSGLIAYANLPASERRPIDPAPVAIHESEQGGRREADPRTRPNLMGKIVAIAKDGKSITLEVAPGGRGEPAKTVEVKLAANAKATFSGVGIGGAKLMEGYTAAVWTAEGANDTAERLQVRGGANDRRGADLVGRIATVTTKGKTLVLQLDATRSRDGASTANAVYIRDKSQVLYSNVGKGGARPEAGYYAQIWFEEDAKPWAAKAVLAGNAESFERGRDQPKVDYMGRVAGVSKDGTVLTLESPARERGAAPATQEIKLSDKTASVYFDIGPDGDRPSEGYAAQVWLAEGSKDTAAKIHFRATSKVTHTILRGKVTGIGKDGKSLTLETPPQERGGAPMQTEVKLGPKCKVIFNEVGPEGALITEGYIAHATLAEGSTDTAAMIVFGPAPAEGERR
jgi:RNA polymerase sigma factor (sigma-70 family)